MNCRIVNNPGCLIGRMCFFSSPEEYFLFDDMARENEVITGPSENGNFVIDSLTVVPHLQEREILLETYLPSTVIRDDEKGWIIYTLRIQKQPGIISPPVKIFNSPPEGFISSEAQDNWISNPGNSKYYWKGEILLSTDFQLVFNKVS